MSRLALPLRAARLALGLATTAVALAGHAQDNNADTAGLGQRSERYLDDEDAALPEAGRLEEPPNREDQRPLEPPSNWKQDPELEWANLDPQREGAGVVSLSGELGILDPSRADSQQHAVGGGFSLQVVGRRKNWPLLVGLGVGIMTFSSQLTNGPIYGGSEPNGGLYLGTTTLKNTVQLRHAELVARIQPWWGWVRPYIEGEFGVAGLWQTNSLLDNEGTTLASRDKQRSVSYLTGASLGFDIKLATLSDDVIYKWDLVLSAGAKRLYTGQMASPLYTADSTDGVYTTVHTDTVHSRIRIWQPFLSICLAGGSKPRPPRRPRTD